MCVEFEDGAAIRPARAPEFALRRELQIVDAYVAEVLELTGRRIERFDAVAGGHIEQSGRRVQCNGLRDAVAESSQDNAGQRVEQQERAATGRRPELSRIVERHVEDRFVEFAPRSAYRSAFRVELVYPAAILTAADEHFAARQLQDPQCADVGAAVRESRGERLHRERVQYRVKFRRMRERLHRGYAALRRNK